MNTDIRISTDFFQHPKTVMLEKRLGPKGVLSLIKLWIWAAQTRPDGVLGKKSCEYVAAAAMWKGDCHKFVDILLELELLDEDEDGVLSLHNWGKRQPYATKSEERVEKARKAAAARWEGKRSEQKEFSKPDNAQIMPETCSQDAHSNAQTMLDDASGMPPTQPNQTEVLRTSSNTPLPPQGGTDAAASDVPVMGTDETRTDAPAAEPVQVGLVPEQPPKRKRADYRRKDFEAWKTKYGVKVDDDRLWKVWRKQILKIPEQAVLMAALDRYQQSRQWQDGYIKKPDNYLRDCCWNDDFAPAQPAPRRSYGPDANGRTPYVREDEQDFSNVPLRSDGSVNWEELAR